jgi:O-glycosyl hydrolase
MKKSLLPLFVFFMLCSSVSAKHVYTIHPDKTFQTIRGFGAADAWSNEVINLWNDSFRNRAADWLFSKELTQEGNFKGIGLSIWRYNLGAGSSEQGDSSLIGDPYRRTECFLSSDGTYDFREQTGAQWLLQAAKCRGLENLVMFSNSPPVSLTRNGKAFAGTCHESNLSAENYDGFAEYITKSLQYYEGQKIHFDYVSPVNEPEWGWCRKDGQEGNPYANRQISELTRRINSSLVSNHLDTKIQVPESGLLVFANPGYKFKPDRQNEINSLFRESKENYLGDQSQVARQVCAHSYFTEWPLWINRKVRKRIARTCEKRELEYWMSEYCILKTTKEITGGGRDLGMNTALYVSRVIHHDLVYGNASAWCWWLGISTADFKDGLVYTNRDGSGLTDSKTMWAMGNFSQFIHPGAVRVEVKGKRDKKLFVSAYQNTGSDDLVVVVINMKSEKQAIRLKNLPDEKFTAWETSEKLSLSKIVPYSDGKSITVSPESVTTLLFQKQPQY